MENLAERIISGGRLDREDGRKLLEMDLEELCRVADEIRRAFCGDKGELCTIVNGRSGRCSEDCKFCAQSCHYHTGAEEYPFLSVPEIVEEGKRNEAAGVHRYSIVTAGRGLHGSDLEQALEAYRQSQEDTFSWYLSQNLPKVQNARTVVDGDYILFVIGENPDAAEEAFHTFVAAQNA